LTSMWMSSPGRRGTYRFGGSGGASRDNRFKPTRASTAHTVETAICNFAAIAVLVIRVRRNISMSCSTFAGVRDGTRFGADDRSTSA
jgi:hypothetical protein